jgi:hypothetical protein
MIFFVVVSIAFPLLILVEVQYQLKTRNRVNKLIQPHLEHVSKRKSRIERLYLAYSFLDHNKMVVHHMFLQSLANGTRLMKQLGKVMVNVLVPLGTFIVGLFLGGLEIDAFRRIDAILDYPVHFSYFVLWLIVLVCVHFAVSNRTRDIITMHQVVINQILEERKKS